MIRKDNPTSPASDCWQSLNISNKKQLALLGVHHFKQLSTASEISKQHYQSSSNLLPLSSSYLCVPAILLLETITVNTCDVNKSTRSH